MSLHIKTHSFVGVGVGYATIWRSSQCWIEKKERRRAQMKILCSREEKKYYLQLTLLILWYYRILRSTWTAAFVYGLLEIWVTPINGHQEHEIVGSHMGRPKAWHGVDVIHPMSRKNHCKSHMLLLVLSIIVIGNSMLELQS